MNKSFQGSIYLYYYLDVLSNVTAVFIVGTIYRFLGMRNTVVYMLSIAFTLLLIVLILEMDKSRHHSNSEPYLIFGIKICNNV